MAAFLVIVMVMISGAYQQMAFADTAAEIDRDVDSALDKLYSRSPASVVIVDEGVAKSLTTTTAKSDICAFFFDQKGLRPG